MKNVKSLFEKSYFITFLIFLYQILPFKLGAQSFQWAKCYGASQVDYFTATAVDNSGNVYASGEFSTTVDIDPSPNVLNITSFNNSIDFFIMKLDTFGNLIWVKQFGTEGVEISMRITTDLSANIYLIGHYTSDSLDCDPGPGTSFVYNTGNFKDIVVIKLDSSGNFIWGRSMGSPTKDEIPYDIEVDVYGNVYSTGIFGATADFDPSMSFYNLTAVGPNDAFISKLDVNGNFVWAKQIGGAVGGDKGSSIKVDINSNVLITGLVNSIADLDPGPGVVNFGGSGICMFVISLNSNGDYVWGKSILRSNSNSMDIDFSGNIYITGIFNDSADMDPGPNIYNVFAGGQSAYILKLNTTGDFIWARTLIDTIFIEPRWLVTGNNGEVYTMGTFLDYIDLDPGQFNYALASSGNWDIYMSALDASGNFLWGRSFGGWNSESCYHLSIDPNGALYFSGMFQSPAVDFDPGPGTFNVNNNGSSDGFLMKYDFCGFNSAVTLNGCDFVVVNGINYNNTGNYLQTFIGANDCDSVVMLTINIGHDSYGSLTDTICGVYNYYGQMYSTSGIFTQNIPNASGCDSIMTLNLTIHPIDLTLSQNGSVLTSNQVGATYQWLRCNPYQVLPGETNPSFNAVGGGQYAVIVTYGECSDTTACLTTNAAYITDLQLQNTKVFPNPANEILYLQLPDNFENVSVRMLDCTGRILVQKNTTTTFMEIPLTELSKGLYYIELSTAKQKATFKFSKL
ncbi:MAG: SBBP repeat-containing protein [Bacteroidetes bacterium]|jgi:hypothetical protein|nr:SBBP repeat-containing protein [Bacteroidota bacterium]MBK7040609.1 SBBP repeat-containing protein [Bacteroidota bacterium]MBK7589670.1 SBBP repeat-containing protein [Bacteroidota bacterium]MBK9300378.1 SBBP repeat-containing protein [Bacteroidota bacterium]MBK9482732.1 SBBP repeat-containing protein [Bacteroidota bacterium]